MNLIIIICCFIEFSIGDRGKYSMVTYFQKVKLFMGFHQYLEILNFVSSHLTFK